MAPPITRQAMPAAQFKALARLADITPGTRVYAMALAYHVERKSCRRIAKEFGVSKAAPESARERIDKELRRLVAVWDDIVIGRGEVKKPPATALQDVWR